MGTGMIGMGLDGEKLVGMGWVWGEQVVPVQLSIDKPLIKLALRVCSATRDCSRGIKTITYLE